MRSGTVIALIGLAMTAAGLVMFYALENIPSSDAPLRAVKHAGTFIGLMGIGVIVAGVLLYLINRPQPTNSMGSDLGT
ncbi:MAG: hypothetical protein GWN01_16730 [Nitrosopumilaceae archaeon]|nr:hypothetical protein [Nitrosopumilaceae archaeon]NIU02479.1 hypothetical protein [Nitrosopumilaceae archaeon]NIU88940.1 hypothetical protein [Nitrosopumilaceae archaeon]NIV67051.1 hypothetical protein [Nitrosopumilaceae archaeon]NIX63080.1 hypothetical protein [Nitrosopumilaceae archaeon]